MEIFDLLNSEHQRMTWLQAWPDVSIYNNFHLSLSFSVSPFLMATWYHSKTASLHVVTHMVHVCQTHRERESLCYSSEANSGINPWIMWDSYRKRKGCYAGKKNLCTLSLQIIKTGSFKGQLVLQRLATSRWCCSESRARLSRSSAQVLNHEVILPPRILALLVT